MFTHKDYKLLYELDSNSRRSFSAIGKEIRMSEQLVSYKFHVFNEKKIIQGHLPVMDYSRFGLLSFMVFFKVYYESQQKFQDLISRLCGHWAIISIFECDGKYDLIAVFAARNPSSFNKMLKRVISEHNELRNWMILTTVVEHHYLRNYLSGKRDDTDIIVGGDREEMYFDEFNRKLISALLEGKKRTIDLAEAAGITPKTVLYRLACLERERVIKRYRVWFDGDGMGITTNVLLVKYRGITSNQEEELRHYCRSNPFIIEYIKTLGEWDFLLMVETRGKEDFRKLSLLLREKFNLILDEMDNFRVFSVHKRQFLPRYVLEEKSPVFAKKDKSN